MKKIIIAIVLFVVASSTIAVAQKKQQITVDDYKIVKVGQNVQATIKIANHNNGRGSYKVFALPQIVKGNNDIQMPAVVFRTTKGRIIDFRNRIEYPESSIVTQKGDVVEYTYVFPYKKWMNNANLLVEVKNVGCCREIIAPTIVAAQNIVLPPDTAYKIKPALVYIKPEPELKSRVEVGSAFLEFPVGSSKLIGDFKNNAYELAKINNSINEVVSDISMKNLKSITIWGTCSPEGPYKINAKLAQGRAIAVKDYIIKNYPNATSNFIVTSTPENWKGLVDELKDNDQQWAKQVVDIASSDVSDDYKDKLVKQIDNGVTFKYLIKEMYPKLRRVDYKINYTIRDFTPQEVAQVFGVRPQDLSLNELYYLALTYSQNSPQFYNIMRTAAALYPNDDVANLNAATVAVQNGNVNDAIQYLSKVKDYSKQYYNTLGVIQMIMGDYNDAAVNLNTADKMGLSQAQYNLKQLKTKLENIEVLKNQN